MCTASSAISTCSASRSASEYTATVAIPILRAVLMIRQAISPRLAIRMRLNMPRLDPCPAAAFSGFAALQQESQSQGLRGGRNNLLQRAASAICVFFTARRAEQRISNCAALLAVFRAPPYMPFEHQMRATGRRFLMALALGDTAPDFEAETTEGRIKFHDWIGDKWAVLFSHPKDFTPVCTTELGYMAKIKPEFDKRGVKIIGLSVDPVDRHAGWAADIKETQGTAPNYPMIGDTDFNVSKLYGMLPAAVSGDPAKRTAADNQTVRNVFVIGPDKKVKLILVYPMTTGRNFDKVLRVIDSLQMTAKHKVSTPAQWKQGEDVIISGSVNDEDAKKLFPGGWKSPKPYIRIVPQPRKQPSHRSTLQKALLWPRFFHSLNTTPCRCSRTRGSCDLIRTGRPWRISAQRASVSSVSRRIASSV